MSLLHALALVLLLAGAAAGTSCAGKGSDPAPQPVALLTAFEPFGGKAVNSSWEAVKGFEGQTLGGYRIAVERLPVVYDEMAVPLEKALAKHKPVIVVGFGLGRDVIHVERLAKNEYSQEKPVDNLGKPPPRAAIVPGGPVILPARLPVDEILVALERARLQAFPSEDAGGYLCNECFYRLMAWKGEGSEGIVARGFVHLPDIDAPNPAGGTYTLDRLREAVRIVVETTARVVAATGSGPGR